MQNIKHGDPHSTTDSTLKDLCFKCIVENIDRWDRNHFCSLPQELLVHLLDLIQSKSGRLNDELFRKLLCPQLRNIRLASTSEETAISSRTLLTIPNIVTDLESLTIEPQHEVNEEVIGKILSNSAQLKVLELRGFSELRDLVDSDYMSPSDPPMTFKCDQLRVLDLLNCKRIKEETLCLLGKTCFSNLQRLSLTACMQLQESTLLELIPHCKNLTKLSLADCEETSDLVVTYIATYCEKLVSIDLSWCEKLSDVGILELTFGCPLIETLKIRHLPDITDAAVEAITRNCSSHLRSLYLSTCDNITSAALMSLGQCTSLERLDLCWVQSCGNNEVISILYCCPNLKVLRLEGCKSLTFRAFETLTFNVDDPIAHYGRNVPKCASTLKLLDLSWCNNFTSHSLSSIIQVHPNITIIDYYGCFYCSHLKIKKL